MADILIIGGGVAGLLTARELALAGVRVTLLEKGVLGGESSWAGGGILSPLHPWREPDAINRLCRWSQEQYPALTAALREDTGIDPEWWPCGALYLDYEDWREAADWCRRELRESAPVNGDEVAALQRGLCPAREGLWLPWVGQVRNPRLLRALRRDLSQRGVTLLEGVEVTRLRFADGRLAGIEAEGRLWTADRYVLTAGAWCAQLLPSLQVKPVRGQMLLLRAEAGLLERIVLRHGHYLIPRRDGRILAGSTVEEAGYDKTVTAAAAAELKAFALATLPALADCVLETQWAGLRPGTPAGIPYIGVHPQFVNLYFNCGHFRNGFVMGPAGARLVADLLLGRPPIVDPGPYALDMFH